VRARGTGLPIWVGRPGVVGNAKLLRVSAKIGLAESARFVRAHRAWLRRLVSGTIAPSPLIERLAGADLAGLHFYTFNELERTERWRHEALARLGAAV
jgi:methylenetetrahydrofolate reductase (NADPH)